MIQVVAIMSALFIASIKCKFLSIKISKESPFIVTGPYDNLSFIIGGSLTGIIMNSNNIEIIISSSKQVKIAKEIAIGDRNYPQWRLSRLIYSGMYEGIHLSKRNNQLIIHSLVFEVHEPISFSTDTTWSIQANGSSSYDLITFSGPNPSILYQIIKILSQRKLIIQFFRNSCLIPKDKSSHFYIRKEHSSIDVSSIIAFIISTIHNDPSEICYFKLINDKQIFYSLKIKKKNSFPLFAPSTDDIISLYKPKRDYRINSFEMESNDISSSLEFIKNIILPVASSSTPIRIDNIFSDDIKDIFAFEMNIKTVKISKITLEIFLKEIFQFLIEKLFFELSVVIPMVITFTPDQELIILKYEKGVFAPALGNYLLNLFEKEKNYKVTDSSYEAFEETNRSIRIEDDQERTFAFNTGDLDRIDEAVFSPFTKRVFLFKKMFSFGMVTENVWPFSLFPQGIKKELKENITEKSVIDKSTSPSSSPPSPPSNMRRMKKSQIIETIEKWESKSSENSGIEIIFYKSDNKNINKKNMDGNKEKERNEIIFNNNKNNQNDKTEKEMEYLISINILELKDESIQDTRLDIYNRRSYSQWDFFLCNIKFGAIVGETFIDSYKLPFYLWRIDSKSLFISAQRINFSLSSLYDKETSLPLSSPSPSSLSSSSSITTLEIKEINKKSHVKLLKILLMENPICEINGFRLKHGFLIEIDLVKSTDIEKFIEFISKELETTIKYRIKKDLEFREFLLGKHFNFYREKHLTRLNFHGNLSWIKALKELLGKKSNSLASLKVIERSGNKSSPGTVSVIYHQKGNTKELKEFLKGEIKNRNQIVRIGRIEDYPDMDYSFVFIQYAVNIGIDYTSSFSIHSKYLFSVFDLENTDGINSIIQRIVNDFNRFSREHQPPWKCINNKQ